MPLLRALYLYSSFPVPHFSAWNLQTFLSSRADGRICIQLLLALHIYHLNMRRYVCGAWYGMYGLRVCHGFVSNAVAVIASEK